MRMASDLYDEIMSYLKHGGSTVLVQLTGIPGKKTHRYAANEFSARACGQTIYYDKKTAVQLNGGKRVIFYRDGAMNTDGVHILRYRMQ